MPSISESDIDKGQAVYTPMMLKLYNLWVLDISNSWIWRCPKKFQLAQFNQYATVNHLDIGVGTGYYLKKCQWPDSAKVSIMDLNQHCLDKAKLMLGKQFNQQYTLDIFKGNPKLAKTFDSISMNYLLHCLPGNMATKSMAINNAVSLLKPGGTLFGATILSERDLHTSIGQKLCDFYNKKGIFSNQQDTLINLKSVLAEHLTDLEVFVIGCVALFKGKRANR